MVTSHSTNYVAESPSIRINIHLLDSSLPDLTASWYLQFSMIPTKSEFSIRLQRSNSNPDWQGLRVSNSKNLLLTRQGIHYCKVLREHNRYLDHRLWHFFLEEEKDYDLLGRVMDWLARSLHIQTWWWLVGL
jgi:hypothetical protein